MTFALQVQVVAEAVKDVVHAIGGDAVDELDVPVGGPAALLETDCSGER